MTRARGVCPMCRKPTAGAADVLPSGAFVARKACPRCVRASSSSRDEPVEIKERPTEPAGVRRRLSYVKCGGPCGRVLPSTKVNRIMARGKRTKSVCSDCLVGAMRATAKN